MLEVFSNGRVWQPAQDLVDGRALRERWCGVTSKTSEKRQGYKNRKPQYQLIELYPEFKKRIQCRVHRLVACAFLGLDYDSDLTVDHINCDKSDNSLMNLRVVTMEENNRIWMDEQSQSQ